MCTPKRRKQKKEKNKCRFKIFIKLLKLIKAS